MKIRFYLALAAAALVMTNCSKEEEPVQEKQQSKGFTATIEGASRSAVTDAGVFSWTAGDKISVWNGLSFDTYANSDSDVNTFNPEGDADIAEAKDYAVYPASAEHNFEDGTLLVNLPASYAHGSTNAPMLATIEDGSTTLAFRHLAGVMRFVVKNVPAGASSFVFTTTNNIITGSYSVIEEQIWQDGENSVNNNNSVTITFDALTEAAAEMVFYVPLPVGTYGNYTVAINGTNVNLSHQSTGVTNTIGRRTLLLMPEFSVENGELKKGEGNVIPVTQNEAANLSGIQNVTIGTDNATANDVLNINYTPSEGNAALNIKDDSNATESQENSKGKIVINPQGSEAIESLNLNTPSLTAELGAGTYGTVEALTAQQTLIIGDGVTIETLILNGGALEIAEGATNVTIGNIVVKDAASFIEALKVAENITLADDVTEINLNLTTGNTLTIESGKEVAIDLNNKKLITSTTNGTGDDITVSGKLNILNGTIETAQTGFFVNGELVLNNCTIEGKNPEAAAVVVLGSNAKLEAVGCTTNAANSAFYALQGAQMTLTNCTVSKSVANTVALVAVDGQGSVLEIDGGSYTGKEVTTAHDRYVIGVMNQSSATINTTVSGGNGGVTVIGASTAELTGGSYSGVKACGLYVAGESTVTYSDNCTFSGVEGNVVVGGDTYGNGTVNGTTYTVYTKIQ